MTGRVTSDGDLFPRHDNLSKVFVLEVQKALGLVSFCLVQKKNMLEHLKIKSSASNCNRYILKRIFSCFVCCSLSLKHKILSVSLDSVLQQYCSTADDSLGQSIRQIIDRKVSNYFDNGLII